MKKRVKNPIFDLRIVDGDHRWGRESVKGARGFGRSVIKKIHKVNQVKMCNKLVGNGVLTLVFHRQIPLNWDSDWDECTNQFDFRRQCENMSKWCYLAFAMSQYQRWPHRIHAKCSISELFWSK